MVPKIIVEWAPNPNYRKYNVNTEISQHPTHFFWRPLRESSEEYLEQVGEIGSNLLRQVFDIQGVDEVFIAPYDLSVIKAEAFDWEEIEPSVILALEQVFGEVEQEVMVIHKGFWAVPTPPTEEEVQEAEPGEEGED